MSTAAGKAPKSMQKRWALMLLALRVEVLSGSEM